MSTQRPHHPPNGEPLATPRPRGLLAIIVVSQFAGTSLWFAGNAIAGELRQRFALAEDAVGDLTSAIQLGFIAGTLVFATLSLADRFAARRVFFCCSLLGATANLAVFVVGEFELLLLCRFATGIFLAGIYPVGMKIAASWYDRDLGRTLGLLVGALVAGTALPHLLRSLGGDLPWEVVLITTSGLAVAGAFLILLGVTDGPFLPARSPFAPRALLVSFRSPDFRSSACGYFGHMWELYSFWAFAPFWITAYAQQRSIELDPSWWTFVVIVSGSVGCIGGGVASRKLGSGRIAAAGLIGSTTCCFLSPFLFTYAPPAVFLGTLVLWGIAVAGDSPQFSTINARTAPREYVGSALTLVNSIGFLISIPSLQMTAWLTRTVEPRYLFVALGFGPLLGWISLRSLLRRRPGF